MNQAFEIIYQDSCLVVINKIARLIVLPTPKKEKITLTSLLQKEIGKKIYPCHRLDRDTRGLMVYTKSKPARDDIINQFRRREVKKKYFVLSQGNFNQKEGVFKSLIIDKQGKKFREEPKKAETYYRVIRKLKGFDFLEVIPKTGRTNQIRIQLAAVSHPVLGEKNYAFRRDFVVKSNQLGLFACFLSFRHPLSRKLVFFKAKIPGYMEKFIEKFS